MSKAYYMACLDLEGRSRIAAAATHTQYEQVASALR